MFICTTKLVRPSSNISCRSPEARVLMFHFSDSDFYFSDKMCCFFTCVRQMSQLMRLWYLSHRQPAKAQAKSDLQPHWMAAHARLKNDSTEDEKCHNHVSWLKWSQNHSILNTSRFATYATQPEHNQILLSMRLLEQDWGKLQPTSRWIEQLSQPTRVSWLCETLVLTWLRAWTLELQWSRYKDFIRTCIVVQQLLTGAETRIWQNVLYTDDIARQLDTEKLFKTCREYKKVYTYHQTDQGKMFESERENALDFITSNIRWNSRVKYRNIVYIYCFNNQSLIYVIKTSKHFATGRPYTLKFSEERRIWKEHHSGFC